MKDLSTYSLPKGSDYRFRLCSTEIDLGRQFWLSPKTNGCVFSSNELGFDTSADRKEFLNYLKTGR